MGQEPSARVDGSAAELGPALTLQPRLTEREISCKEKETNTKLG